MAERRKPLSEDDLVSILRKEESAARLYQTGTLSPVRTEANDYYDRQPYGTEQDGSSKVVTSEFMDVVEGIMPGLMEVFAGGDQVVQFTPLHPGDEQYMEEARDRVSNVFMSRNKGFILLHTALKDGIMSRMGAIDVDLTDEDEVRTKQVQGIPQDAVDLIIAEAEKNEAELEMELTQDPTQVQVSPDGMPLPPAPQTFSGTITVTRRRQVVVCNNIAPWDVLFTPTARDQDKCSFIGFMQEVTASDLVKLGVEQEEIDELDGQRPSEPEEDQITDSTSTLEPVRDNTDDSERPLWLIKAYVRADFDGTGISTTERILYAHAGGNAAVIIEREPWDDIAWIALASPILMPHRIIGRSMFDWTKDIQEVQSSLTRGLLDNLNVAIRPRPAVSDQVILDSVLDWVPGAPVRFKAGAKPGDGHIVWEKPPNVMPEALAALEYFNTVRENRTGTNRQSQGLDSDSLNKTARGMNLLMSASSQRQKLIARVFAETFVARVYRLIYRAIKKAATGPEQYWTGSSFKTVDPTKWPADVDLTVNVGLGTGNAQQEIEQLTLLELTMEKLVALQGGQANGPFVLPDNVANLAQKKAEKLGFKTPGLFFQPPEKVLEATAQPQPPKPDPEMVKVQGQLAAQKAKQEGEMALAAAKAQAEAEQRRAQAAIDMQLARERADQELQFMRDKAALELELERDKAIATAALAQQEADREFALEKYKIDNMPKPGNTELQQKEVN